MSGSHQSLPHIFWKNDIHDVDLLNDNSVTDEFLGKVLLNCAGNFSFDISHVHDSLMPNEVPDALLTFLLQELLQSVWPKVVEELLQVLLLLFFMTVLAPDMEVDSDIESYHNVVLGRNVRDWALESYGVFGYHHGHSPCITQCAETAVESRIHDSSIYSETLSQSVHSIGDVNIALKALRKRPIDHDHEWHALFFQLLSQLILIVLAIWLTLVDQSWALLDIARVNLIEASLWP